MKHFFYQKLLICKSLLLDAFGTSQYVFDVRRRGKLGKRSCSCWIRKELGSVMACAFQWVLKVRWMHMWRH